MKCEKSSQCSILVSRELQQKQKSQLQSPLKLTNLLLSWYCVDPEIIKFSFFVQRKNFMSTVAHFASLHILDISIQAVTCLDDQYFKIDREKFTFPQTEKRTEIDSSQSPFLASGWWGSGEMFYLSFFPSLYSGFAGIKYWFAQILLTRG